MSKKNTKDDFERKIEKTDFCWLWRGKLNSAGYGSITFCGKKYGTHRLSYEIYIGPIPDGMCVLHKCDNRKCVNPSHLWIGTNSDNQKDCIKKERQGKRYKWTKENNPNAGIPMSDKNKAAMSQRKQKPFQIRGPNENVITGTNLTQFCKDNGLNQGAMWSVMAGKIRYHKGYTKA